jgi:replicative DNA helicase
MGDLRESGEIEDSADAIMLLYREEYYYRQTAPKTKDDDDLLPQSREAAQRAWQEGLDRIAGKAEIIVPKVRRSEAGVVHLWFNGAASRFEEGR